MKALTIRQPFASLIVAGLKEYETRSWKTDYRGELAIHAGGFNKVGIGWADQIRKWMKVIPTSTDPFEYRLFRMRQEGLLRAIPCLKPGVDWGLPYGAVIGIVKVRDVAPARDVWITEIERSVGIYDKGYAWQLEVVDVFPFPIPAKGKLGLWEWERP